MKTTDFMDDTYPRRNFVKTGKGTELNILLLRYRRFFVELKLQGQYANVNTFIGLICEMTLLRNPSDITSFTFIIKIPF